MPNLRRIVLLVPNPKVGDVLDFIEQLPGASIELPMAKAREKVMERTAPTKRKAAKQPKQTFVRDALLAELRHAGTAKAQDLIEGVRSRLGKPKQNVSLALWRLVSSGVVDQIVVDGVKAYSIKEKEGAG